MAWFREMTFGELLDEAAERHADRTAISFGHESVSFRVLRQRVDRIAVALIEMGVRPGDVVGLWMPNRVEWVLTQFAVAKVGAILLPINTALRADDCAYVLRHSDCVALIMSDRAGPVSFTKLLREMAPEIDRSHPDGLRLAGMPSLRTVVVLGNGPLPSGVRSWDEVTSGERADSDQLDACQSSVRPNDMAIIMYTSGTTGTPKGVTHSHHAIRNVIDEANRLAVRTTDVTIMFLPLFHAYGLYEGPLLSLVTGARCVLMDRFEAGSALQLIEEEGATLCFGFSAHFQDLLEHEDFAQRDVTSLRAGIMAVGPASMESLARRVQRTFPGKIVSGYGMTEIGVGATLGFLDEDEDHSAATSGYPLPGYEFRIVDHETGRLLSDGSPGEVLVRTYQMTEGYLKDEAATNAAIDSEGWLSTGDLGVRQSDGYIRILGRYKDILRVGGENVDPAEVEGLYLEHPAVGAAVLVGVPDERLDEVGCLCVVLSQGYAWSDGLEQELIHFADSRLASFKRPRYVRAVDVFPMTASGKIQRHEARDDAVRALGLN